MAVFYPECQAILQVVFDGFGDNDKDPVIVRVFPKSATVHSNGYSEADTWDLEFDAKDLPFEPDMVRTAAAQIWMFGKRSVAENSEPYINDDNLLIAGLADNGSTRWAGDGRMFRMDGRDYTALMLDRPWDPTESGDKGRVPIGKLLTDVVQDLVDESVIPKEKPIHSGSVRALTAVTGALTSATNVVGSLLAGTATNLNDPVARAFGRVLTVKYETDRAVPTVGPGLTKTKGKRGITIESGKNYWDVIYGLCIKHGLITFVRGTDVVITEPHALTKQSLSRARVVAYGTDLSWLEAERKWGKEQVPQIVVSSYDSSTREIARVIYPEEKKAATTGVGTKKDERLFVTAPPGVKDPDLLREFARTYYNNIARGEGKVRLATRDLQDLKGASLLTLRAGDSLAIQFDAFGREELRQLGEGERKDRLIARGYSEQVAALVAEGYEKIKQFERPFYVKDVGFSWSNTDGLSIEIEAMNFVVVERDELEETLKNVGARGIIARKFGIVGAVSP